MADEVDAFGSSPGLKTDNYPYYPPQPDYVTTPTFWSAEQQSSAYSLYDITFAYFGAMGNALMPVQGRPTDAQVGYGQGGGTLPVAAEIVQVCAPWMKCVATWMAYRTGQPPDIPDWRPPPGSSIYTLHKFKFGEQDRRPNSTGVDYIFRMWGEVIYFLKIPLTPDDGYPLAASPVQTLPVNVLGVTAAEFNKTIFPL
jgi:hypothetical protein